MGHSKPTTTLAITYLFATDDHAGAMAALGSMVAPVTTYGAGEYPANVLPFVR